MPKVRAFVDFLATTFGPEPPWEQGWTLRLSDSQIAKRKGGSREPPLNGQLPLTLTFTPH